MNDYTKLFLRALKEEEAYYKFKKNFNSIESIRYRRLKKFCMFNSDGFDGYSKDLLSISKRTNRMDWYITMLLSYAFSWANTDEGYDYWEKIYLQLEILENKRK